MKKLEIGIIGGGAAGMTAAIIAAREGAKVTILEGNDRIGKKILSTGNGKCNLGNLNMDPSNFYCKEMSFLENVLEEYSIDEVIYFFRSLGLLMKEKDGYLYPYSEQAASVLDVLRYEIDLLDISVITNSPVTDLQKDKQNRFRVIAGGNKYNFDKVILCTGGKAAPKTGSDGRGYDLVKKLGHSICPVVPALVQVRCKETFLKGIAGVRAKARICFDTWVEEGEVQFTDYGISGIPVFQLSRCVAYELKQRKEIKIHMDLMPDLSPEDLKTFMDIRVLLLRDRTVEQFFTGLINKKIISALLSVCGLKPDWKIENMEAESLWKVFLLAKDFVVTAVGTNSFDQAQVSAGGVDLKEVKDTLESRLVPGLYFAGEILDVDGKCGGYNLYFAWATGAMAAMNAWKE